MRLVDCYCEVFVYVYALSRAGEEVSQPFDQVRGEIEQWFSKGDTQAKDAGFAQQDVDAVRFAICTWVDEIILTSDWRGKLDWMRDPLQHRMFDTANAGEEFVNRLQALDDSQNAAREVFALCLSLGFTGPYFSDADRPQLEELKKNNLKSLWGSEANTKPTRFFPFAYPANEAPKKAADQKASRTSWRNVAMMMVAPVLLVVLFLVYVVVLDAKVSDFFESERGAASTSAGDDR